MDRRTRGVVPSPRRWGHIRGHTQNKSPPFPFPISILRDLLGFSPGTTHHEDPRASGGFSFPVAGRLTHACRQPK